MKLFYRHYFSRMSQEFDMGEFWTQYDDQSRLVAPFYPLNDRINTPPDNFLEMVDEFLEIEETKPPLDPNSPDKVKRTKRRMNIESNEKIIKKMYGVKDRHPMLLTDEDKIIKNRIEEIFNFMRNENT
jgi:hypothetical protein